jgi:hypothetical protein
MNALDDGIISTLDEGVNFIGAHGCESQNRYQLFGLEQLANASSIA